MRATVGCRRHRRCRLSRCRCQLRPDQHRAPPHVPAGYEVQTVRIVTHALSAARSAAGAAATAALLERLCLARGISFLSLGATSNLRLLEQGCFSKIAACTSHSSCSFRCGNGAAEGPPGPPPAVQHMAFA